MAKKTKAQIKRLLQRAAARGETYVPPEKDESGHEHEVDEDGNTINLLTSSPVVVSGDGTPPNKIGHDQKDSSKTLKKTGAQDRTKRTAAMKLTRDLATIESNEELKAKDRRSAKRKAEAIAVESSGCGSVEELLKWYEDHGKNDHDDGDGQRDPKRGKKQTDHESSSKRSNPYIVFIGQMSYDTTKESLFRHFRKHLKEDNHHITPENFKIRFLTDPKTKKSRGMAFVEVCDDPELLYSCLKLHHTHLEGRRINVERSAGGGKNSETRKAKLEQFRKVQVKHMEDTVVAVLNEYYQRGEIQEQGELDEGVILLCKRHSAAVVQASLDRYVESNGRDMDNPSAYLTFLLGKLAEEGIYNDREKEKTKRTTTTTTTTDKAPRGRASPSSRDAKRLKKSNNSSSSTPTSKFVDSGFFKQGVDMEAGAAGVSSRSHAIFPSLARRGRGRGGYM